MYHTNICWLSFLILLAVIFLLAIISTRVPSCAVFSNIDFWFSPYSRTSMLPSSPLADNINPVSSCVVFPTVDSCALPNPHTSTPPSSPQAGWVQLLQGLQPCPRKYLIQKCLEELPFLRSDNVSAHRDYLRQYCLEYVNIRDDLEGNEGPSDEEDHSLEDPWEDLFPIPSEEELFQWSETRLAAYLAQVTKTGDRDPIVRHVMETEITRIWRNLQWQPGYVMSDEDFKVFTFFQYSYPNHPIAIEAMRKYRNKTNGWEDTLSEVPRLVEAADSPKTINKTAYSKEHSRPDRRTQDVGNSLENPLKGNRKHDREDSDTEDAPEVPTDTPEAPTDFEESSGPRDGWEGRDSCKSPAERPHTGEPDVRPSWADTLKGAWRLDASSLRLRLSPSGNNIRQNMKPGTRRPAVGNGSADRFKENIKPAPTHAVASHGCPHPRSSTQRTTRGPVAGNGSADPLKDNKRPDTERPTTSRDPARQRLSELDGRRVSPGGRTTPHDDSNCLGAKALALRGISRSVANKSQAFPGTTPRPEEQSFVEGDSDNNDVDHLSISANLLTGGDSILSLPASVSREAPSRVPRPKSRPVISLPADVGNGLANSFKETGSREHRSG